jgi:hypothetical protein
MGELKPCPFCGGEAEINLHDGDAGTWIARCANRGCTTWPSTDCLSYGDSVAAWNRRAVGVPLTDEQIERVLDEAKVPEYPGCEGIDVQIVRAIERAHGIAATPASPPDQQEGGPC